MFHLAPMGLAPGVMKKVDRSAHYTIERDVTVAVGDVYESALCQKIVYNLMHPDTKALLKSLDTFFAHGLIRADRCYWCFVEEFVPASEQHELRRQWNCSRLRPLSIAWLKDSMNKSTLHFQMLAFASPTHSRIRAKWYNKNACLRNQKILTNICALMKSLEDVEFQIETPYIFRTEEVPIALPPQIHTTNVWAEGVETPPPPTTITVVNATTTNSNGMDVVVRHRQNRHFSRVPNSYSSMNSYIPAVSSTSHLSALTEKLPEVDWDLPASVVDQPFLSTARDQNYVIDELVQSHRKRVLGYFRQSETSTSVDKEGAESSSLVDGANGGEAIEDSMATCSLNFDTNSVSKPVAYEDDDDDAKNPFYNDDYEIREIRTLDERQKLAVLPASPKSSEDFDAGLGVRPHSGASQNDVADKYELSDLEEDNEYTTGAIPVDSGEIVHMAMEIFRGDGERFQALFQVYTGHSAGQPQLRYMAVTDQYIYLLSSPSALSQPTPSSPSPMSFNASASPPFSGYVVGAALADAHAGGEWSTEFGVRPGNSSNIGADHYFVKYVVHSTIAVNDLAFVTVGIDAQVFCLQFKKHKYLLAAESAQRRGSRASNSSASVTEVTRKQPFMVIDSGSKQLTKLIAKTLRQTFALNNSLLQQQQQQLKVESTAAQSRNRSKSANNNETCSKASTNHGGALSVLTRSTPLSIIVQRFLKQELALPDVDVIHFSLVYWIEVLPEAEDTKSRTKNVEGYLNVRRVYPKSWVRRTGEWQYSYFVFMGCMLYQFSDSACKFAQRAYNIREKITQVYEADLKNEDGFVFQLELDDEDDGGGALQFKCPSHGEMKKWMDKITLALSISNDQGIPVACQFMLTDSQAVFAQEGANCAVDGFMRALATFSIDQVETIFAVRTEFHNALVIQRRAVDNTDAEGGALEWLFLRDERELRRLCATFAQKWHVRVEENEETSSKPQTFNRIYKYCARMSAHGNLWMCNYNGRESGQKPSGRR